MLYPPKQCTGFVAQLRPDLPFFAGAKGDARNWSSSAAHAGWIVDQTPAVGAVAVFQPGQYGAGYMGHVAYVTAVRGDRIVVLDRNWRGNGQTSHRVTRWSGLDFIHSRRPAPITEPLHTTTTTITVDTPLEPNYLNETTGGYTHTWSDYTNAGGVEGPIIATNVTVQIACKIPGFVVADGNPWWYRVATGAWHSSYYASADAFYNNGQKSGTLVGTPDVDPAVPDC